MSPSSSTTTTSQRQLKFSSRSPPAKPGPRTCMTRRSVTTPSAERSLHHCSLRSDKNQRAADKAYHSYEEKLLPAQSFFAHSRKVRPVHELCSCRQEPSRKMENETIRILLERQEQIFADFRAEIQKHEFQANYDRRSIRKLNGVIESQRGEINRALEGDEPLRRYQQLLHEP